MDGEASYYTLFYSFIEKILVKIPLSAPSIYQSRPGLVQITNMDRNSILYSQVVSHLDLLRHY